MDRKVRDGIATCMGCYGWFLDADGERSWTQ